MTEQTDQTVTAQANGTGPAEAAATAPPVATGPASPKRQTRATKTDTAPAAAEPCAGCAEQLEGMELLGAKVDALSVQVAGLGKVLVAGLVAAAVIYFLSRDEAAKDG